MHIAIRRLILLLAIALLNAAIWPSAGWSADTRSADTRAAEPVPRLSDERQQSALEFVKEHHPQLSALITRLKKRDPAEYHKALADVFKTYERLQRMEDRDQPRYEVELKLWKVNSRIRLLAARMAAVQAIDRRPELESQVRELLHERTDLRLQQLTLERERLNNRIERVDAQISQLSSERETVIDREVERLQRSVRTRAVRVSKQTEDRTAKDAGTRNRGEQKSRAEQNIGASRQDHPSERPAKTPSN